MMTLDIEEYEDARVIALLMLYCMRTLDIEEYEDARYITLLRLY